MHVSNVLTGYFFDDQSSIVGDKEAAVAAFTFTWGTSGEGNLGTQARGSFPLCMGMQVIG